MLSIPYDTFISAQRGEWLSVPNTTHQFLVTNFQSKFDSCSKECNRSNASLAPFLPKALLSIMNTTETYKDKLWTRDTDTGACMRLFRSENSEGPNTLISFMQPSDCGGDAFCICWNGTRDSQKSSLVKPTTATQSTSTQQAATKTTTTTTTTVSTPHDNETNPFISMSKERLNNWNMYDLQELYINTNKTSHDNASRFCRDELNSTLVTVLNPLEYLRLLKTMGLKTGIFWIGKYTCIHLFVCFLVIILALNINLIWHRVIVYQMLNHYIPQYRHTSPETDHLNGQYQHRYTYSKIRLIYETQ